MMPETIMVCISTSRVEYSWGKQGKEWYELDLIKVGEELKIKSVSNDHLSFEGKTFFHPAKKFKVKETEKIDEVKQ